MITKLQSVKGTKDLLPIDSGKWQYIENRIRAIMDRFGYDEIRTPLFEETTLFARGIGQETDIVGKEMYTFLDKGETSLTLRPEMTASVVRSYIQHHLGEQESITKLYYIAPMFRQERPQAGRLRQFHQFGMEAIGQSNPLCDTEIIAMTVAIYSDFNIPFEIRLNSVGDELCRPKYRDELKSFLKTVFEKLSPESKKRCETNVLRVLDSKDERDREVTHHAPKISDYLCENCHSHFESVKQSLAQLNIGFIVDHRLVRGLDYYTKTAFEFISNNLGAQDALGGGGRYDSLIEELGGTSTPAVGYAAGIERLAIVLDKMNFSFPTKHTDVYMIGLGDACRTWAFTKAIELRKNGVRVEIDYAGRSFKAQMRDANKLQSKYAIIIGDDEMRKQSVIVKDMSTSAQEFIEFQNVLSYFENKKAT